MKFIFYNPKHFDSNNDGIVEYNIVCATMRLTGKDKFLVRFIVSENGSHFYIDDVNRDLIEYGGWLSKNEHALAAKDGTVFQGWKRTKQYRLTKEEIESFIIEEKDNKKYYKVFIPNFVAGNLPSYISGKIENRGYLDPKTVNALQGLKL